MTLQDTTHISGLAELDRKLGLLPIRVRRNVMKRALRAGGAIVARAARAEVPSKWVRNAPTRLLKKSNITWRVGRLRGNIQRVKITWKTHKRQKGENEVTTQLPWYAHWIEFGIPSKGIPAESFLQPAWQQSNDRAHQAFARVMGEGIDAEARKLNSRRR